MNDDSTEKRMAGDYEIIQAVQIGDREVVLGENPQDETGMKYMCAFCRQNALFAEQEQFRDWLLSQPPAEILNHAYEYTVREDILMSLEYHDLEDSQARALLKSDKPLKQIFERWENQETSYMDTVWDTVQEQARAAEAKQKAKAQKER